MSESQNKAAKRGAPRPHDTYVATQHDLAAVERLRHRMRGKRSPRFVVKEKDNAAHITAANNDSLYEHARFTDLLVTGDVAFSAGILRQMANVARNGKTLGTADLNFVVATVNAITPRDSTEALLALQMAAIHNATMIAARRLNQAETVPQQDSASNMFNKLARTFAMQLEALKRHRSNGEQKVTVQHQHVNVNANQAVLAVRQGGGDVHENTSQPLEPCRSDERGPTLLGHQQADAMPMPSTSNERLDRLPVSRSAGGSTQWKGKRRVAARHGDECKGCGAEEVSWPIEDH